MSEHRTFQQRVKVWMMQCFSMEICRDRQERNHRFLEEALELTQSCGCTASEAHQLVDYVYGRELGDVNQEVGGVMVTLAALCLANDIDMHQGGETELARISIPSVMSKIRDKQASKPKHSPLPQVSKACNRDRLFAEMVAALEAAESADEFHVNCEECDGELTPEECEKCFPLFDDVRVLRREVIVKLREDQK